MLLLTWQKNILSGYFKVLHTNTAYCHAVGKKTKQNKPNHGWNLTVLFNTTKYSKQPC